MADSSTTNIGFTLPEVGASDNTWGDKLNANWTSTDNLLTTATTVTTASGTKALSSSEQETAAILCTATLTGNLTVQFDRKGKWYVYNGTSGSFTLTVEISGQSSPPTIPQGTGVDVYSDGTNVYATALNTATTAEFVAQSASDALLTPANLGNRPRFHAHKGGSDQTVSSGSFTKLTWSSERFDVGSYFSSHKWTPPSGYVMIGGQVMFNIGIPFPTSTVKCAIYKNGSAFLLGDQVVTEDGSTLVSVNVQALIDCNGTDYFELYAVISSSGAPLTVDGSSQTTYFWGFQV